MSTVSNNGTSPIKREDPRAAASSTMLPQWALEMIRPVVSVCSRALWKIEFRGVENVPEHGGVIIAANHQTYLDPFWLSLPIKRPTRYLAWSAAFRWPVVGTGLKWLGAWPLALEGGDPAAIRTSLQWLRNGGAVVIFPEGGRSTDTGELDRFKAGAVRLALEAEVPILPVTIKGGNRVWPRGWRFPRTGKVVVTYHPIIHAEQCPNEETRAYARRESEKLAAVIASAL
ncbi:MAG TPA: lysophospholipid acyltransferase family protein [Pyrinomonadaceae bacterium]|nr:lysophospholipid acyltransferase family protein [Pyrinomonadaceae bacterium]